ncbi:MULTISPECIES: distal tail protein Dit [Bacillus cereus group]|uniref:distal tail protein Dit n=1 Tax=Bacillus cereus group TaxID=86661 RepID=UPI0007FB368A|nr:MULTISPECIES: distal tail protein Dit [Bacillus cereus group]MCP1394349.1 putative phage tail component-like protein [Bacillus cereus]OBW88017.1 phage tail protein [Bacillus cereus]PDX91839.1 phage tail protein [Bacillus thuringiensis]PER46668.1 phage tail protein [Bacillus thuringiensis]PEV70229.1 phage tail protein [Bacillus thuringiensis]
MSSFTFNNIRKDFIQIEKGWKRPAWAPLKRKFLSVPGYPGARLLTIETEMRVLPVPVGIIVPDGSDLETLKEEIAEWLITEKPVELVFDVTPDRTYLAVIDEDFDPEDFITLGKGTLNFVCPMPYKLGPTKTLEFEMDGRGLIANVQNKGSVESNPIIEVEVTKPSTFLDVWNGTNYFRIGYPLKADQVPVERNQRVLWDEMGTTIGWTDVPKTEDMTGGGKFKSDGYRFMAEYLGEPTVKGWHGCIAKKNIPQGPLQDFIMQAYVHINSYHWDQMGRVEIGLLDENSDYVARISMSDVQWEAEQNSGFASVGNSKKPGGQVLINEHGDHPDTWTNFRGRLWLARTGNRWEAYISKFILGTEIDDAERFVVWFDENNVNMNKVTQVQISISQFSNNMFCSQMSIDDLKIWKVNMNTQNNPPYIFDVGDKVVIDTERSLVTINGKSAINLKDIFSDFPVIHKGSNKLEIMPSTVGTAKVTYRERFR